MVGGRVKQLEELYILGPNHIHSLWEGENKLLELALNPSESYWFRTLFVSGPNKWDIGAFHEVMNKLYEAKNHTLECVEVEKLIGKENLKALVTSNILSYLETSYLPDLTGQEIHFNGPVIKARSPLFLQCWKAYAVQNEIAT